MNNLLKALKSKDLNARRKAAARLKRDGDLSCIPEIIKSLLDPTEDEWVCIDLADALGNIGDKRAVPALIEVLYSEVRVNKWKDEWEKLGSVTDQGERYRKHLFLSETLVVEISDLRVAAATALGKIGGEEAVVELTKTLVDKYDHQLREASQNALRRIGTPTALAALANIE